MPPLNYTTKVPANKTVQEMQAALGEHGASAVTTMYANGLPTGIAFQLNTPHGPRNYSMNLDIAGMRKLLSKVCYDNNAHQAAHMTRQNFCSEKHASDVTWRVAREWLLAQLAMVAAAQVPVEEIMLPYLVMNDAGSTLREQYRQHEIRAITT